MPPSSRRFLLRERTSNHHAAVDAAVGSFQTLEHYRTYLQGILAFRQPLERSLMHATWPEPFGVWRPESLSPLIIADMNDLNVNVAQQHTKISDGLDLESLLGALYVLEGSSLGARILYSRAKELGLTDKFGARHLAGQAHSGGFKKFLEVLDAAPNIDMNKVVEASRSAFNLAESAFQGNCECMMPKRSI